MKKTITSVLIFLVLFSARAQYFQKAFGVDDPNQQEMYSLSIDNNNNIYAAGTFRNINYFEDFNFRGALSKLSTDGSLLWSKVYLPSSALPMEGMFINSIIHSNDNALYAFATYLGLPDVSGYYLIKFDNSGGVIWSKFINNENQIWSDVIYANNALYAILIDKIVKFNLDGEIINSVKIDLEYNISLRKACKTEDGNIVVTGDAVLNSVPGMPILTFNQDLNLVSSFYYNLDLNGAIGGSSIIEAANNKIIIGASGQIICIDGISGAILWSKIVQSVETDTSLDSLINLNDIKTLNTERTEFFTTFGANYFDNETNLIYIVTAKLDEFGNFSEMKAIKRVPFDAVDSYLNAAALSVDPENSAFFMVGSLIAENLTTGLDNHLNYIHKGNLNQLSCGEENIPLNFIVENTNHIYLSDFPSNLIIPTTIEAFPKTLVVADVVPQYNNQYCIDTNLSAPEVPIAEINITPNPTQNVLNIQTNQIIFDIAIFDVLGKKVYTSSLSTNSSIDVSQLTQGIYFLKITNDNGKTFSLKFIKH